MPRALANKLFMAPRDYARPKLGRRIYCSLTIECGVECSGVLHGVHSVRRSPRIYACMHVRGVHGRGGQSARGCSLRAAHNQ